MSEDIHWLRVEPMSSLISEIVTTVVKQYRIDHTNAEYQIHCCMAKKHNLRQLAEQEPSAGKLKRTRAYKDAVRDAKKTIYYSLRRYTSESSPLTTFVNSLSNFKSENSFDIETARTRLLKEHKSTQERYPCMEEFHNQLFVHLPSAKSILDVGCGLYPLMYPFENTSCQSILQYTAVDKDPAVINCVNTYARVTQEKRLIAMEWEVADGWDKVIEKSKQQVFDIAFLFKFVPVIARQLSALLNVLIETPARIWVVTGSKKSMTKNISIEKRERAVVNDFVQLAGRTIKHEVSVGEEFCLIVE